MDIKWIKASPSIKLHVLNYIEITSQIHCICTAWLSGQGKKGNEFNIVKHRCTFLETKRSNAPSRAFVENKISGNR